MRTAELKAVNSRSIARKKMIPLLLAYGVMLALFLVAGVLKPGFLSAAHIGNVLRQAAFLGIVCIGQTLVILTGGIDLSVTYMITFSNIVSAQIMAGQNETTLFALMVVVLIGVAVGLVNGLGVYVLRIPPMIMTLATSNVILGISYIYCNGSPKGYRSPAIDALVNQKAFFGLFNGVTLIWVLLSILVLVIMSRTVFGRAIHAIGVNRQAARQSGINVPLMLVLVYVASAVMACVSGILLVGYTGTSYLSTGDGYSMDSIAAVVVGGTSIAGGKGGYLGTIAGALIMTVITSLMTMLDMNAAGRLIVQGLIILGLLLAVYARERD